jgi:hypothetical protein
VLICLACLLLDAAFSELGLWILFFVGFMFKFLLYLFRMKVRA